MEFQPNGMICFLFSILAALSLPNLFKLSRAPQDPVEIFLIMNAKPMEVHLNNYELLEKVHFIGVSMVLPVCIEFQFKTYVFITECKISLRLKFSLKES